MPIYRKPTVTVLAMTNFIASPGRIAQAGALVELTTDVARTAIALGIARVATERDLPPLDRGTVEVRDPAPTHRDPRIKRRR